MVFPRIVRCVLVAFFLMCFVDNGYTQEPLQANSPPPLTANPPGISQSSLPVLTQSPASRTGAGTSVVVPPALSQTTPLPPDVQETIKTMGNQPDQDASTKKMPVGGATPSVLLPSAPSVVEKQYREGYSSLLSTTLLQFGYEIFASMAKKPSQYAVPRGDYIIGPGDNVRVRVWGAGGDGEYEGVVSREGSIDVPQLGIINVAGVRYSEIDRVIAREAEKYVQGINIKTSLQQLRSVEVYVVGAVQQPGLHMVPAFSTVIDGLLATGGVKKTGTLRDVQLYRGGKLLKSVDLYDLLLKGDRNSDLPLQDHDVLFVPRIHETAAVAGAAIESGIYELKGANTVGELLKMAGGLLPQGFTGRMYLRRFVENHDFVVQDITATPDDQSWKNIPVRNGDLLELGFLGSAWPLAVYLDGHVKASQVRKYEQGTKLSDLLTSPKLLKPEAITDYALLRRYDEQTARYTVETFPLARVFAREFDLELRPFDRIQILSREESGVAESMTVAGGVWKPGTFSYGPGLTLATAISLAGGEKFGANLHQVEVSRQVANSGIVKTDLFVVDATVDKSFVLQPFDYVFVPQAKDAGVVKTVTLSGEVRYPGTYRIKAGERLSEIITRAGGFLPDAYFFGAKLTTKESKEIQKKSLENLVRELEMRAQSISQQQVQTSASKEEVESVAAGKTILSQLIQKMKAVEPEGRVSIVLADLDSFRGSAYDFTLQDSATLHIPVRPSFVSTIGSVYSSSSYLFEANKTVGYYLAKSGGVAKNGDAEHMYLLRANGEVVSASQQQGFFSGFESYKLMPGDALVVPEDLEKVPYLRLVKDISDIVFKIATTAGIAIAVL